MKRAKAILAGLVWCMLLLCNAWAENALIPVQNDGKAVWEAVEGAVEYQCIIVNAAGIVAGEATVETPEVYLVEGFRADIYPVFADGTQGAMLVTEYFGEPATELGGENGAGGAILDNPEDYIDWEYDAMWSDMLSYQVLDAIQPESVMMAADGSIQFTATAPNGTLMRFVGTNARYADGTLILAPGGKIVALDAIGRICAVRAEVAEGYADDYLQFPNAYTFTDATSVSSLAELYMASNMGGWPVSTWMQENSGAFSMMHFQPNFIAAEAEERNQQDIVLSALTVYYDETTFTTGVQEMALWADMYGSYLAGEPYDAGKEVFDEAAGIFDFYLMIRPALGNRLNPIVCSPEDAVYLSYSLVGLREGITSVGDFKDAQGNVVPKDSARVTAGSTVSVTVGKYTADVALPVLEAFTGAQTLHELTPYNNAEATGEVRALVVPIYWQDQAENATDEVLQRLRARLGRIVDENGVVTDYSQALTDAFSLSAYYDTASYGQHAITSFVTAWYPAPYAYQGEKEMQYVLEDTAFVKEIHAWLMKTYPDMDWTAFDRDADGLMDAVILLNVGTSAGDTMYMGTYGYAQMVSPGYTGENAGTPSRPNIKNYVGINVSFLESNTLIHEYAHGFGLVDYYDVRYSGIDAVGGYDMQSQNMGDWNAYSKYAVGWIQPQVVTEVPEGTGLEITIGALSDTGDAIVIPARGVAHDGPFGEYLLIDLMTDGGVNRYDAPVYGLKGVQGVRITHVNATMEKRVLTGTDGVEYPIGTIRYTNSYEGDGVYLLEVIQAGGSNTFTDLTKLRTQLSREDLFQTGDVFTATRYAEFLQNGCMDDGTPFGYRIEIVRVGTDETGACTATIRVVRE